MSTELPSIAVDPAPAQRRRILFLVANAHLDTQWRWTVRDTIRKFIPATLRQNFAHFKTSTHYRLSFEGAFRYMLMREYYPLEYQELKHWVAEGRWAPAGSMLDAVDVNLVSPESLIRHILYGNAFFEREFGRRCNDLFLPDGFGFGFALPTIAAHCGLKGFSSQKFINWMAPAEIPFEVGFWRGPDGNGIVAVLDPEAYGDGINENLAAAERWIERIDRLAERCGVSCEYKYFGIGDRGGAVDDQSVEWLEKSPEGGPIEVKSATSGEFFDQFEESQIQLLPEHSGELLLPTHGTGCLTSQAAMKGWNRANEQLAQTAEHAAVAAMLLGTRPYPAKRLEDAWIRFLWHQMHDDLTGTSIPAAYEISWNDEIVALNQFAEVLADSVQSIAARLDTDVEGYPLVVFNPLGMRREDLVRANIPWTPGSAATVRVFDGEGAEVPSQARVENGKIRVTFLATVESLSLSVYEVRPSSRGCRLSTGLSITETTLSGPHLVATCDHHGNLAGLVHRASGEESLGAPVRLELLADRSNRWPAWEILFEDLCRSPVATSAARPTSVGILEDGPASVALEVRRTMRRSSIRQVFRLVAGEAGTRLEVETDIHWRTFGHLLKASFPLRNGAEEATYDLGCGTIRRGVNRRAKYEVPAQQWADLSSAPANFGVSILSDCRYGWDHPDAHTLRLSLVRSPRTHRKFRHQARQDFGHHQLRYALYPHVGDWSDSAVTGQGARLNQPLRAFVTERHAGKGQARSISLLDLSSNQVKVHALKKAEEGDGVVLRLQEACGREAAAIGVRTPVPIVGATEVDGCERQPRPLELKSGRLRLDFEAHQLRTLRLDIPSPPSKPRSAVQIPLPWNLEATSFHGSPPTGDFDGRGHTLPGELLEPEISFRGLSFGLGPLVPGQSNAVACAGQQLEIPASSRLWLLAASADGDVDVTFELGGHLVPVNIQSYTGFVGQWRTKPGLKGRRGGEGFIKRAPIAWLGTHRHDRNGADEAYIFCYLFGYSFKVPNDCTRLRLPEAPTVRILAASADLQPEAETRPASQLY